MELRELRSLIEDSWRTQNLTNSKFLDTDMRLAAWTRASRAKMARIILEFMVGRLVELLLMLLWRRLLVKHCSTPSGFYTNKPKQPITNEITISVSIGCP